MPYRESDEKKRQDEIDKNDRRVVDKIDELVTEPEKQQLNSMRVQLQQGTSDHVGSLAVHNVPLIGVSYVQISYALDKAIKPACDKLPRKCRALCKQTVEKMKGHAAGFLPAGIAENKNVGRKTFCCPANNKIYRIDLENSRGHNLRR